MASRRSIVQFEKWLDGEIKTVQAELAAGLVEAEELARQHAGQQIRLETLRSVKGKLSPGGDDEDDVPVTNGATAEPSLAFEDPDADADTTVTQ